MGTERKPSQPISDMKENIGKLLLDMAKLIFASLILGSILRGELPQYMIIAAGCILFAVFAVVGLTLSSPKKDRR